QRIQESMNDKYSRIQALENEIEHLKALQKTLITTEKSISAKKTRYRGTLSPLRRTPPEIIAKIIAFSIHRTDGYVGPDNRKYFRGLRAVCQLWRRTALSTPYLW
ncbi:hypothetical protein BKA70DRAFT_1035194, partial [Coprinopsis sp. MPI-PUGE-AT-0042]